MSKAYRGVLKARKGATARDKQLANCFINMHTAKKRK